MMSIIDINSVTKVIDDRKVLDDISLSINKGEILGLVGPNGAGKTTLFRIILGLISPSKGSVKVFKNNPIINNLKSKMKIGALLEHSGIYDDLTVKENLIFFGKIYKTNGLENKISKLLEYINLSERANDIAGKLSLGMKKKLAIARVLISDPEILLFDEPTSSLDVYFQNEIRCLINDLSNKGKTIILSSHNLNELSRMCSSIVFLNKGKITPKYLLNEVFARYGNLKKKILFKSKESLNIAEVLLKNYGRIQTFNGKLNLEIILSNLNDFEKIQDLLMKNVADYEIAEVPITLEDIFFILLSG